MEKGRKCPQIELRPNGIIVKGAWLSGSAEAIDSRKVPRLDQLPPTIEARSERKWSRQNVKPLIGQNRDVSRFWPIRRFTCGSNRKKIPYTVLVLTGEVGSCRTWHVSCRDCRRPSTGMQMRRGEGAATYPLFTGQVTQSPHVILTEVMSARLDPKTFSRNWDNSHLRLPSYRCICMCTGRIIIHSENFVLCNYMIDLCQKIIEIW